MSERPHQPHELPAPPVDPRSAWNLPAPGQLPVVHTLDELVTRVLAPNPSPMTLDGTNTYVIAPRGSGVAIIVDPGPDDTGHRERVERALEGLDVAATAIVVTHHHLDHAEAAGAWSRRFACPIVASTARVAGVDGRVVADGDRLRVGDLDVEVLATPGHTRDHVALRLPTGALLTGDHILGRGTSVVAYPDGDLTAYLQSLRRVHELGPDQLLPGHGPELTEDPEAVLRYYREHRAFREAQVLAVLASGTATPRELVAHIYADVDRRLWDAAEASTRATVASLVQRGRVRLDRDDRVQLTPGDN